MPRSTSSDSAQRDSSERGSSVNRPNAFRHTANGNSPKPTEKFPDLEPSAPINGQAIRPASRQNGYGNGNGNGTLTLPPPTSDRWLPQRDSAARPPRWGPSAGSSGPPTSARGHSRQKSISDAFKNIRARSGSVSQNATEIAGALRAPVSPKLIALCIMWYTSSAMTNTSAKSILNAFDKPATLTLVQFAFVSSYCLVFSWLAGTFPAIKTAIPALKYGIRHPSIDIIRTTLPLAFFQIGGHLLSSNATSLISVSLVHTIKGLSPLFTVFAYRIVYNIQYPMATYLSLIPLTLGVMLACSGNHSFGGELLGILYALLATLIFVTQNIFSKKLFNEAARAEAEGMTAQSRKLDKLNLLCYSSGLAFLLTAPIWFWSEGWGILGDFLYDGSIDLEQNPNTFDHGRLFVEFVFNGTFHFGQNILAFVLLSLVSPVTYSVASLIKRVFVIVIAILWFRSPTTRVQALGIALTFFGLYLYDRTKEGNKADRKARMMLEESTKASPLLPLNTKGGLTNGAVFESPASTNSSVPSSAHPYTNGYARANGDDSKKSDGPPSTRMRGNNNIAWLPPGTRQEDTWRMGDKTAGVSVA